MVIKPVAYQEVIDFVAKDDTKDMLHTDLHPDGDKEFRCLDFCIQLKERANAIGMRCAVILIGYGDVRWGISIGTHTMNAFETTDNGIVYLEIQDGSMFLNEEPAVGKNLQTLFYDGYEKKLPDFKRHTDDMSYLNTHTIMHKLEVW
jgi:hypothetical protein